MTSRGGSEAIGLWIDGEVRDATVDSGLVASVSDAARAAPATRVWTTGFVDIHCHGGAGHSFDTADADGVRAAVEHHRAQGTAAMLLSLVSADVPDLVDRLRSLREVAPSMGGVVGVHLEGPFLASSRRGAHSPSALTAPTDDAVHALLDAGEGVLRQVTIAPELPGALRAVDAFVAAGVRVAVGHTDADYSQAAAAFDRGASLVTHALNAMPGLGHREPGPVGAAVSRDHVVLEVIADDHHIHPVVVSALFAAAPGRIALVTDAMSATGLDDGAYEIGALPVDVRGGVPYLRGTSTLAGSTLTMARAVETAMRAGVPRNEAMRAATTTPAALFGVPLAEPGVGTDISQLHTVRPPLSRS